MRMNGLIGCLAGTILLASCDWNGAKTVSTSMIHIPATASSTPPPGEAIPAVSFDNDTLNLGILAEGEIRTVTFEIKNAGEADLVITDVSTSCGCTVAERYPTRPLGPGETAPIKVTFDSRGRVGRNEKDIFVVTNAVPSTSTLHLTADVIGPEPTN